MALIHRIEKKEGQEGPDLMFFCPACQCGHAVWLQGPTKWTWNGSFEKPTFAPSLLVTQVVADPPVTPENLDQWNQNPWPQTKVEKRCHSHVTDGMINYCADSTHALAGKTIPMEDF